MKQLVPLKIISGGTSRKVITMVPLMLEEVKLFLSLVIRLLIVCFDGDQIPFRFFLYFPSQEKPTSGARTTIRNPL